MSSLLSKSLLTIGLVCLPLQAFAQKNQATSDSLPPPPPGPYVSPQDPFLKNLVQPNPARKNPVIINSTEEDFPPKDFDPENKVTLPTPAKDGQGREKAADGIAKQIIEEAASNSKKPKYAPDNTAIIPKDGTASPTAAPKVTPPAVVAPEPEKQQRQLDAPPVIANPPSVASRPAPPAANYFYRPGIPQQYPPYGYPPQRGYRQANPYWQVPPGYAQRPYQQPNPAYQYPAQPYRNQYWYVWPQGPQFRPYNVPRTYRQYGQPNTGSGG